MDVQHRQLAMKARGKPRDPLGSKGGARWALVVVGAMAIVCGAFVQHEMFNVDAIGAPKCGADFTPRPTPSVALRTGASMPILGLGTWLSKPGQVRRAVFDAIAAGYRHIDTAWIYNNEVEVGQGIADAIGQGLVHRRDLFVTGKLWNTFHRREDVARGLNETLENLGLSYVDLFLIHWPVSLRQGVSLAKGKPARSSDFDSNATLIETWKGMEDLAHRGLAKAIGVSNFGPRRLAHLLSNAEILPAVNQIEMHPYLPQEDLLHFCKRNGIAVTAYSPLGSPGRDTKPSGEPTLLDEDTVAAAAQAASAQAASGGVPAVTRAQALLLWAWHRGVIAIPKSVTKARIQENFDALSGMIAGRMRLTQEDFRGLCMLQRGLRYVPGTRLLKPGQTVADLWGEVDAPMCDTMGECSQQESVPSTSKS